MQNAKRKIAVIGLGYVGLPVAVAFATKYGSVIGYDINAKRLTDLQNGIDTNLEFNKDELSKADILYTNDLQKLRSADFFIVTVPTPIDQYNNPDFTAIISATNAVASVIKYGDIVVYESTVYPGATEEICIPILQSTGLKCGNEFGVGYSPERINPADKNNTFANIAKVVSGCNDAVLKVVADTYSAVIEAAVHKASSIKVAEAAKVIENIQRDVNVALINELAILFDRLEIDTIEVLEAAGTKWNFLPFRPGLVGGHCIGVDPYYLTYKAESIGYHPEVILSGRRINNYVPIFIASKVVKLLSKLHKNIKNSRVAILGLTFKENCPDIRNTKVIDIIRELQEFDAEVLVYDPLANKEEAMHEYGIKLADKSDIVDMDVLIFAVAHDEFKSQGQAFIDERLKKDGLVIDIKAMFGNLKIRNYWRL